MLGAEFNSASNGITFNGGHRAKRQVSAEIPVKSGFYAVNPGDIRLWTCADYLEGCVECRI